MIEAKDHVTGRHEVPERADSDGAADVTGFFAAVEQAHANEDVAAYLSFFDANAVWVTSRGVVYRGIEALGGYLRAVIPGGLAAGSVSYVVESVHLLSPGARVVIVAQTYLDARGRARDESAAHTHTYVLTGVGESIRIVAGQNTVRS
jgi:uncharacterized protein (TIGR02246 family)